MGRKFIPSRGDRLHGVLSWEKAWCVLRMDRIPGCEGEGDTRDWVRQGL